MNSYDVVEHAGSVALEAEFRSRWLADREQMWVRITMELPPTSNTLMYPLYGEVAPPPKVLAWWRRMAIRLLGGQP